MLLRKFECAGHRTPYPARAVSNWAKPVVRRTCFFVRMETSTRLQFGLFANVLKICCRNKGPSAEVLRWGKGDGKCVCGGVFRVVLANFLNQAIYKSRRSGRPSSQSPRNCRFVEETASLKQLNQEKKGKKETLHKARPKLTLLAYTFTFTLNLKRLKYHNNSEISGSQDFHYDTSIKQGKVTEKERPAFISCSFEGHFWR